VRRGVIATAGLLLTLGYGLIPMAQAQPASDIRVLQQQVQDLQARVAELEKKMFKQRVGGEGLAPEPKPGGWKVAYNWQLMRGGLDRSEVRERLGEPDNTRSIGKSSIWEYGDGKVRFYLGRVKSFVPANVK
jgi:hypothetical protein